MPQERLDKFIASTGKLSRKEVKALVRSGCVLLNNTPVSDVGVKTDPQRDAITVNGQPYAAERHVYIMLNKPEGVVSASRAGREKTVTDLVPPELFRKGLFPAGRLDKDTTGFVLITDDGEFAHRILSPKNHVKKTYVAQLAVPLEEAGLRALQKGIELRDGTLLLPATVEITTEDRKTVRIIIFEGKYHQIKRMFAAADNRVVALTRTHMGDLPLDPKLKPGECRLIQREELLLLSEHNTDDYR